MSSHNQPYDLDDRCPSTAERIAQYDAKQAALAPPGAAFDRAAHAAVPGHFASSIVVNPQVVKAEMRKLAKSLATIISNPARAHAMLEKTHYDLERWGWAGDFIFIYRYVPGSHPWDSAQWCDGRRVRYQRGRR